jgi:hypothetical protein
MQDPWGKLVIEDKGAVMYAYAISFTEIVQYCRVRWECIIRTRRGGAEGGRVALHVACHSAEKR